MLLHQWFQVAHVKQWYARGETYSLNIIREQYLPRIIKPDDIPNFIIHLDGKPVGYIQLYQVSKSLPEGVDNYSHTLFKQFKPEDLAGIDLFIADENILGKGICSKILTAFVDAHIRGRYVAMIVDPIS